jgi:FkbM family methyltransferase
VLRSRFSTELLRACYAAEPGAGTGWDPSREWSNPPVHRVKDAVATAAARAGFARRRFDLEHAAGALAAVTERLDALERTYALLADERSRELLVRLLVFRVLGPHHVALPVSHEDLRSPREPVGAPIESPYGDPLPLYSVSGRHGEVRLHAHASAIAEFFDLEQYAHAAVAPQPGDVAIDGGAGWGDTALWLADAVGPEGRVISVEVEDANLELVRRNVALNPGARIEVVEGALWSEPGRTLSFAPAGPSSRVGDGGASATSVTIDELRPGRVGFIKLDVEGAELEALRGAETTLREDRPRLAIAAYHHDDDLVALPAYLDELGVGYELYLDHFTPGLHETVLYARAR